MDGSVPWQGGPIPTAAQGGSSRVPWASKVLGSITFLGECSLQPWLWGPTILQASALTGDMQTEEMVFIHALCCAHTLESSQTLAFCFSLRLNIWNVVCIFQKGHVVYLIYGSKEERKSRLDSFWFSVVYKCENWGSIMLCLPLIISQMSVYMLFDMNNYFL